MVSRVSEVIEHAWCPQSRHVLVKIGEKAAPFAKLTHNHFQRLVISLQAKRKHAATGNRLWKDICLDDECVSVVKHRVRRIYFEKVQFWVSSPETSCKTQKAISWMCTQRLVFTSLTEANFQFLDSGILQYETKSPTGVSFKGGLVSPSQQSPSTSSRRRQKTRRRQNARRRRAHPQILDFKHW